ncbi:MAG: FtsX-like permease family protein [Syntrophobacteraceae bacterium]
MKNRRQSHAKTRRREGKRPGQGLFPFDSCRLRVFASSREENANSDTIRFATVSFLVFTYLLFSTVAALTCAYGQDALPDIEFFGSMKDRSAGSPASEQAADYILKTFEKAGLSQIGVHEFLTPIPEADAARIEVAGTTLDLYPWAPNLVYLSTTPREGLRGPLIYAGKGDLGSFNGKSVKGGIVLMDTASSGNWMNAAMLGAGALIFLGDDSSTIADFKNNNTLTPAAFPRFWADTVTGSKLRRLAEAQSPEAKVTSRARWKNKVARNCYGFVTGKDPKLKNELIIIDASYDATPQVIGLAPGADEAVSISLLLSIARTLAKDPPDRTVLFLATIGNGDTIEGMRQFIWALTGRKKLLASREKELQARKKRTDHLLGLLDLDDPLSIKEPKDRKLILQLVAEKSKDKADELTREIQYRQKLARSAPTADIEDPKPYRRLSWVEDTEAMNQGQKSLALSLLQAARPELKAEREELNLRREVLKSGSSIRSILDGYNTVLLLSLYLSSHSRFMGLVEMGESYPVRENIRRMQRAGRLAEMLSRLGREVSDATGLPEMIRNISTGNSLEGAFGKPLTEFHPCCDVGALAGLPAVALMTLDDERSNWGTPNDTLDHIDRGSLDIMSRFLPLLLGKLFSHQALGPALETGIPGLSGLEGQAKFVRQGELFPDQPAPGTIISVIQGKSVFRTMVFYDGAFFIPGIANNRVALEKLVLEPYGLDPETGRVGWTADKVQTGKINYRIRVKSDLASTSLTMFHCLQTDVFQAFDPQSMDYLTKVELLDAATDAVPLRYWFSRVDSRNTTAISVFLEKGSKLKLIMAQSLLSKELFLVNSAKGNTAGSGFLVGDPPTILLTPYQVSKDLELILGERLKNLSRHGIVNNYLQSLYETSSDELTLSRNALDRNRYDTFWKNVVAAWAKLDLVYGEIEKTRRDVLTGVMFFIALFVPFAYCMERYLFAYRSIYRQLIAFFAILLVTIFVIRSLHPAFQLTYSPMVVIIAFFIASLSILVSWIIFMRFEREMAELHSRSAHIKAPQGSKWQAFGAGFAIGASNLNRRKLRTGLTCITLIILTFTVMSFTNVKSLHEPSHTRIAETASYSGILLRNQFWQPLNQLTLVDMRTRFDSAASIWPRGWIDPVNASERSITRIYAENIYTAAEGALGLGENPPEVFRSVIKYGRWFDSGEESSVLLPLAMAKQLKLDPEKDLGAEVHIFGSAFKVIGFFDAAMLESLKDLDQNPIMPAYLELSQSRELSDVEIEAIQSGEVVLPSSERFRYASADRTFIMPFSKCLSFGGTLKAIALLPSSGERALAIADRLSTWLAFPLFVGDEGAWHHNAGTTLRYQGATNLPIPILIVVLITLNTMIGHVHERRREIGTYTSVGLAPTHVGFLFIVEALSLAVISTVIGYILAQLSAKYLGSTAPFSQLTFNYSSLASIACMFLVFSVVFLASLYPARMAAQIAMPDVNSSWSLPSPEGDVLFVNLPFLLKYDEEKGVMGYLNDFYSSYQDTSHGSFIADETTLDIGLPVMSPLKAPPPACLLIRTNVWLAPFDFGIKQRMQIQCCPSEENPGYLELAVQMVRISGEKSAWERANRNFIKTLRKQMLLWRLLDEDAKAHYRQLAPADYSGQFGESTP